MAPFTKHTGSAASLLGSFRMLIGGIITALVSAFHDNTALPMVMAMWLTIIVGGIILTVGRVTVKYRARKRIVEDEPAVLL
jgi:DHA1 family bicyclomycin/chloramphenicol resistance-like MFS transporter